MHIILSWHSVGRRFARPRIPNLLLSNYQEAGIPVLADPFKSA
nr:MAG TPA: hypothetical protein [Caudoviricetes sp.]